VARTQFDPDLPYARIEDRARAQPEGRGRLDNVLDGASQAGKQMMIVRIDGRQAPRLVRENHNGPPDTAEDPGLRVVAVRRQRSVAGELQSRRPECEVGRSGMTPCRVDGSLVAGPPVGARHQQPATPRGDHPGRGSRADQDSTATYCLVG